MNTLRDAVEFLVEVVKTGWDEYAPDEEEQRAVEIASAWLDSKAAIQPCRPDVMRDDVKKTLRRIIGEVKDESMWAAEERVKVDGSTVTAVQASDMTAGFRQVVMFYLAQLVHAAENAE